MSPTKQAKGDSGKEPKLHQWQNGEKKQDNCSLNPISKNH